MEVAAARSSAGNVVEERREESFVPPPVPAPAPTVVPAPAPAPAPGPVIVDAAPFRASSPSFTSTTSSYDTYYPHHHHHHHHEASRPIPVGPVALAERSRSRSRSRREIRSEIRALERELVHRPKNELGEREIVRAERLPDGQLVIYEEEEKIEHTPKPARIEKDKRGRLSLSVPRR